MTAGHGHRGRRRRRRRDDRRRRRRVRGAGAARHGTGLRHDHRGAGPDRMGRGVPLDQPHQRRQRHHHQRAARPARPGRWPRRAPSTGRPSSSSSSPSGSMAIFVASPFGASVRGTRDQPRRMNALGYHVWMIRFLAFLLSGFWTGVAGLALPLLPPVREPAGGGAGGLRRGAADGDLRRHGHAARPHHRRARWSSS